MLDQVSQIECFGPGSAGFILRIINRTKKKAHGICGFKPAFTMKQIRTGIPKAMGYATLEKHDLTFIREFFGLSFELVSQSTPDYFYSFILQPMCLHAGTLARADKIFNHKAIAIMLPVKLPKNQLFARTVVNGEGISNIHLDVVLICENKQ
jgi:hypothetical protein